MKRFLLLALLAVGVVVLVGSRREDKPAAASHHRLDAHRVVIAGESGDEAAAHRAVLELQQVRDPTAVPALREIIETSRSPLLRANAIRALGRVADVPGRQMLRTILVDVSEPLRARQEAALALGELRDRDSVSLLSSLVRTDDNDPAIELGLTAIQALGAMQDEQARDLLQRVAGTATSRRARLFAVQALRG
jgi:HEAT repeat protein